MRGLYHLAWSVVLAVVLATPVKAGKWGVRDDFTQAIQNNKSAKLRHFKVQPYSKRNSRYKARTKESELFSVAASEACSPETKLIRTWLSFLLGVLEAWASESEEAMVMVPFVEALMQPSMQEDEAFDVHIAHLSAELTQLGLGDLTYVQWLENQQDSTAGCVTPIEQEEGLPGEPSGADNVFASPDQMIPSTDSGVSFAEFLSQHVSAAFTPQGVVSPSHPSAGSGQSGLLFSFDDLPPGEGTQIPQLWGLEEATLEEAAQQENSDLLDPLTTSLLLQRRGRRPALDLTST